MVNSLIFNELQRFCKNHIFRQKPRIFNIWEAQKLYFFITSDSILTFAIFYKLLIYRYLASFYM